MVGDLPTGTVTFLFSDIEGSTRLVQRLGDRYPEILEGHQRLLRAAFDSAGGTVLGTEGDSFFVVFPGARQALVAAVDAQLALSGHPWPDDAAVRVRMGLHTGEGTLGGGSYVGVDVHRAARIAAAGHGAQVLISDATRRLVDEGLPDGVALRSLGEHQLKDLLRPERIFQVLHPGLPADFPPLATLTHRPNNLPTQISEFLGREAELRGLGKLLGTESVRLVTLTGAGGIGKTRLALQAAADQVERFADGVFFVELSAARDPDVALEAIARTIGTTGTTDQRPLEMLQGALENRQLLLLLDNFEQVMDAAGPVAELLQLCPGLKILVTSREALRVRGERVLEVPPLSVPPESDAPLSADAAAEYEGVRLFVARAQEARRSFALADDTAPAVADICARLDGLPLAIELAAARLTLFSPHELRDRLRSRLDVLRGGPRDLPARHQALRSTIEWSYELLNTEERSVFQVLSVFATASVDSIEEVAGRLDHLREVDVVDRLSSLVDKSLVRPEEAAGRRRLSMFETIRSFAAERLEGEPDVAAAAREAHADFFSAFAAGSRERLSGSEREATLDELDADLANLRIAWRHWLRAGDLVKLDALLDPLWQLHDARGRYSAAVELTRDLLGVLSSAGAAPGRSQQQVALGATLARGLLALRGYTEEVDEAYGRVLGLLEEAGGLPQLFPALRNLATLHLYRAEFDKAAVVGRQLLELAEHEGDVALQVEGHLVLGANLASLGDVHAGVDHLQRAIALFDPQRVGSGRFRLGPSPGVVARTTSALYQWLLGFPDQALEHASAGLKLARHLDHPFTMAYALFHVGVFHLWRREFDLAHQRATEALEIAEEHGYEVWEALALVLHGAAAASMGRAEDGVDLSDRGMAQYRGLATPPVFWPLLLSVRAVMFAAAGRPEAGLEAIDEALEGFGGRFNILYPELPLIKGDLLLMMSGEGEAEPWFRSAFDVGGQVEARMTQLRAASRLARLPGSNGAQGAELLRTVYDKFDEGFGTADLIEARVILGVSEGSRSGPRRA